MSFDRKPRIRFHKGFTLLELLVVVAIIALLASYVAPRLFGQIGKSEREAAKAQIDALVKAVTAYRLDVGKFPGSEQGLNALVDRPPGEAKWLGPYLQKKVPLDPWGNPYLYSVPGPNGDFEVKSYGKDGRAGGSGEDQDISSAQ